MGVTRSQLGILVAVFVGGAASGVVGWSWSRADDEPKERRSRERAEETLRGVDREELKRALVDLGFRLDEPTSNDTVKGAKEPDTSESSEPEANVESNEGTPVSDVLAALERSYLDQMERERVAKAAPPAQVDVVAELVPEAAPAVEEEPRRVAMAEPRADAAANDVVPVAAAPTHVGDVVQNTVVQNTTVQNTVQQVQVFQPIFFNPGFNPGYVGAPSGSQRRAPSSSRGNDVFRPVDLNGHYANPFSSPPPWLAR